MLELNVGGQEYFNEETNTFSSNPPYTLKLEHSLLSISKWEAKWKKAFLNNTKPKTPEETIDYIRCMTINKGVPEDVYSRIKQIDITKVDEYINDKMTATWFSKINNNGAPSRETITSELIYYWMISYNIPFDCERWHLNRLLTLIRVCESKQGNTKKMSKRDIIAQNRALNASRRKTHHSRG